MKKKKISLFDRAKADLETVKRLLPTVDDELLVDICAYHCQQCIEKIVKFAIELEGKEYSGRHDIFIVIEDLEYQELKDLIMPIIPYVDGWISSTRYGAGIRSSRIQVEKARDICAKAIELINKILPKKMDPHLS